MSSLKVLEDGIEYDVEYDGVNSVWISTHYYHNGRLSRVKGPAVQYNGGSKEWYYQGKKIDCNSQEEFDKLIKLKTFW
jgi:hypothetical protein